MSSNKPTKRPARRKAKGLGDTIEKVTEATGIKAVVKAVAGDDCGCEERKQRLNQLFPYYRTFNPEDKKLYEEKLMHLGAGDEISGIEQRLALDLYNRTTGRRQSFSRCSSCVMRLLGELKTIHEHSCDDTDNQAEGGQAES